MTQVITRCGGLFASHPREFITQTQKKYGMENFKLDDGSKPSEFSIKRVGIVLGLVLVIGGLWFYNMNMGNVTVQTASDFEKDVYKKVSNDAVDQYNIAKRQGDPIQVCVQAGLVSAAYLQEKNESSYQQWKSTEKADCARAGMPSNS